MIKELIHPNQIVLNVYVPKQKAKMTREINP